MSDTRFCVLCGSFINLDDPELTILTNGQRKTVRLHGVVHALATKAITARRIEEMRAQVPPEPEAIAVPVDAAPTPVVVAPTPAVEQLREEWQAEVEEPQIAEPWKAALQRWKYQEESNGETN